MVHKTTSPEEISDEVSYMVYVARLGMTVYGMCERARIWERLHGLEIMGTATGLFLGKYWKKREIQSEFDMLFEEAQRREEQIGKKAWKNAMVMLKLYLETGKSNFHREQ